MPATARKDSWKLNCAAINGSQSSSRKAAAARLFTGPLVRPAISARQNRVKVAVARRTLGVAPVIPA